MSKKDKRNRYTESQEVENVVEQILEVFHDLDEVQQKEDSLEFDAWWSMVKNNIPRAHRYKEIIWADFQSRKLNKVETKSIYDSALKKYGINI